MALEQTPRLAAIAMALGCVNRRKTYDFGVIANEIHLGPMGRVR